MMQQFSEPEQDNMSVISDVESIQTFSLQTQLRNSQLPTYDSDSLLNKIEECIEFLNHVSKFSKKPNYDIISGLTNQISSLMRIIYDMHEDIYFGSTDRFVLKEYLFVSYLPEEIKSMIIGLKSDLKNLREEIDRLNLQQEERVTITENVVSENFEEKFKLENLKNQNLQGEVSQLTQQVQSLNTTMQQKDVRISQLEHECQSKQTQLDSQITGMIQNQVALVDPLYHFDVEALVKKAYANKDQQVGDILTLYPGYSFKQYDNEKALIDTLPRILLETLRHFVAFHQIFQPSVLPAEFDQSNYSIDASSALLHGPFHGEQVYLGIEQRQQGLPRFGFYWKPDASDVLYVYLYGQNSDQLLYTLQVDRQKVVLQDSVNCTIVHQYLVNPDGTLGQKVNLNFRLKVLF